MNVKLPPFKNGEHNSESASTIDRVITPLILKTRIYTYIWQTHNETEAKAA